MKKYALRTLSALVVMGAFLASCGENPATSSSASSTPVSSSVASSSESPKSSEAASSTEPVASSSVDDPLVCKTLAAAAEIATAAGDGGTADDYTVTGKVKSIKNATYGQMTIEDATGELSIYGVYGADDTRYDSLESKPEVGDTVVLKGQLKTYSGSPEMNKATLISLTKAEIDDSSYVEHTLAEARAVAADSLVKVSGVVASINVNSSQSPIGFWLVDGTSSVYVYDNVAASSVSVGNTVTLMAKKAYFISSTEASSAAKWGYIGSNQLTDVHIVSNDKGSATPDYSWVGTTTVKEIMNTPYSEDICNKAYKVNAYIAKASGGNFVNYYIDDIDGKTGSYVYTLASGADLAFMDDYVGKICTVYLVAINAKSAATGCNWRFYPLAIRDDSYQIPEDEIPDYCLEYHAKDQFQDSYDADPSLEVATKVDSEILGFEGAVLTYASSNEEVLSFTQDEVTPESGEAYSALRMHLNAYGKAQVTVTATYNGHSASWSKEIEYAKAATYDVISVADAIDSAVDTEVVVKGVVASGYTNKSGFFLVDETGTIAVLPTNGTETCGTLALGNTVTVKGIRKTYLKSGNEGKYYGQIQIESAEVVKNEYGNTPYSTKSFIKDKTIGEIASMALEPLTAQPIAYECQAYCYVSSAGGGYSNLTFQENADSTNYVMAYGSSISQYSWITDAFKDKTVTVDFLLVNPNSKATWRCIPFKATDGTTTVYNSMYLNA